MYVYRARFAFVSTNARSTRTMASIGDSRTSGRQSWLADNLDPRVSPVSGSADGRWSSICWPWNWRDSGLEIDWPIDWPTPYTRLKIRIGHSPRNFVPRLHVPLVQLVLATRLESLFLTKKWDFVNKCNWRLTVIFCAAHAPVIFGRFAGISPVFNSLQFWFPCP